MWSVYNWTIDDDNNNNKCSQSNSKTSTTVRERYGFDRVYIFRTRARTHKLRMRVFSGEAREKNECARVRKIESGKHIVYQIYTDEAKGYWDNWPSIDS